MRFQNHRNFGYGRNLRFAAKNALKEMYAGGHYSSVASHYARWSIFVEFVRKLGIRDAQNISRETLEAYSHELKVKVSGGMVSVKYAVNIISSINTVLLALRGNKKIWLKPSLMGTVSAIRTRPPGFINPDLKNQIIEKLEVTGHHKLASLVKQADAFGFRLKEAILNDAKSSLTLARTKGVIQIERGTKGGQRRMVPLRTLEQYDTLVYAKDIQIGSNNIPAGQTYASFRRQIYQLFRKFGITGHMSFRELRATFACREYWHLTDHLAPILGGVASKDDDKFARKQIAELLGHHRTDICVSYFGRRNK